MLNLTKLNLILPFSADPYETNNLAPQKRDVVLRLMSRLAAFEATMIPPGSISFSLVQFSSDLLRSAQICLVLLRFARTCYILFMKTYSVDEEFGLFSKIYL
jgi:hypothetical protein